MDEFNGGLIKGIIVMLPFAIVFWISFFGWIELIVNWFK